MIIISSALLLGLMGSFHCAGMCGPIALSLPAKGNSSVEKLLSGLSYNLGRIIIYALIGGLFGLIGKGFEIVGFQKWISIIMGVLMIISVFIPTLIKKIDFLENSSINLFVRNKIAKFFKIDSYYGLFVVGIFNALLPCGLVYLALAGAIGTADFESGILFMLFFGIGTIPMMLLLSMLGGMINFKLRVKLNKLIPFVVTIVAIVFILRGLCLGIPFLSPAEEKLNPSKHKSVLESYNIKKESSIILYSKIL